MQEQRSSNSIEVITTSNEQCHPQELTGLPDYVKLWEDARCPVCLEHPHNSVLLRCSSFHKGCRPFMCNTSHRHSNCLDQFRKSCTPSPSNFIVPGVSAEQIDVADSSDIEARHKLACPLCRGHISGWFTINAAREYMNLKTRSCSNEQCDFVGNYYELRKHARLEHPTVRPSAVNPQRQRNWTILEHDTSISDLLSTWPSVDLELGSEDDEVEEEDDLEIEGSNLEFVDDTLCFASIVLYAEWRVSNGLENLDINGPNNNPRQTNILGSNHRGSLPLNLNNTNNNTNSRNNNFRNNFNARRNSFLERCRGNQNSYVDNNLNRRQNNSFRGNNTERMRIRRINSRRPNNNNRRNGWDRRGSGC